MRVCFLFGSRVARIATNSRDTPRPLRARAVVADSADADTLARVRAVCAVASACGADGAVLELPMPDDPCTGAESIVDARDVDWGAALRWLWDVASACAPPPDDIPDALAEMFRASDGPRGVLARAMFSGALMLPVSFQIASPTCASAAAPV